MHLRPHLNFTRSSKTLWAASGALALAMLLAMIAPALALPLATPFELDGNAVSSTSDDWDHVCHQVLGTDCSTTSNTTNSTAVEFVSQGATTGSTFTGGGSKDPLDISGWAWNQGAGGLPGKDILLNGFAARYTLPVSSSCTSTTSTCSVIFFGMDRFDNSGDAQNGFWFFQNQITLGSNKIGAGKGFVGVHKNGDVLVVSDFSTGGTTSTISVYEWNDSCAGAGKPVASCADTNLQLLQTSNAASCTTADQAAAFCGIVNSANGTSAPWSYTDKSGNNTFQQGEFFEGGINLSAFPGLAGECFASTLAESRSSTSTSAVLKSFVLGNFGGCGSTTVTHPFSGGNDIGGGSIALPQNGSVSVTDQATVNVTGAGSFSGSVAFFLCSPADLSNNSEPTCISGGTSVGSAKAVSGPPTPVTVTSDPTTITSPGTYCFRAEYTSTTTGVPNSSDSSSNECFTVTQSSITTAPSAASIVLNNTPSTTTITDNATVVGQGGGTPTGTVVFHVCAPNELDASGKCSTGGTLVGSASGVALVGVNSTTAIATSATFAPQTVGTFCWRGDYMPATNSVYASASDFSTGECFTVTDTSSAVSAQTWLPNDSATVSSAGGTALNGTLIVALHESGDCSGAAVAGQTYTKTLANATAAADRTLTTTNSTYLVSATKAVSWSVSFTSSDPKVASSSHCETTSLTIAN
jgi:hypothetical protein